MQKFDKLSGIAAHLALVNVDTDMIIPKQFLKTIKRTGLGANLFDEMRFTPEGKEIPDFVLNKQPFRTAVILVSGDNFGCGSSREHAPWALADFGIRCIIAPSFADIFYNNCFKNGILPVVMPENQVKEIAECAAKAEEVSVDLLEQKVRRKSGREYSFEVDSFRKYCLLNALDDIGLTMQNEAKIGEYEKKQSLTTPWLFG
jgi:3-isopropylmalate/(R)-2-methylmalate dehydratase small subunit